MQQEWRGSEAGFPLSVLHASSAPLAHIQRSFLTPSTSSHFPHRLVFCVIFLYSFSPVASNRLLSSCPLHRVLIHSLLFIFYSQSHSLIIIFFSLCCSVLTCLILKATFFHPCTVLNTKRQNKRNQEGVSDNREWVKLRTHAICFVK